MIMTKQLKLGLFLPELGQHFAAWRHPSVKKDHILNFKHVTKLAQQAEAAKFDAIFLADWMAIGERNETFEQNAALNFEPITLLSALASITEKIGLIGTVSTTYNEPFNVARQFASLDHISNGRVGWNIVTSTGLDVAKNFGISRELPHSERYNRADEFVDITKKLWDSWEDDAVVFDQAGARYLNPEKVHEVKVDGDWLSIDGTLTIARPPQGYPVLVQAGSSDTGKEIAAKTAEVVFTAWQTLEEAQAFYSDVKGRLAKYGRQPDELKIMPGIYPIVGRTEEEAKQKHAELQALIPERLGVAKLSANFGVDLTGYDVDGPLPDLPDESSINGIKSRFTLLKDLADRENLTIRQLYERTAGARGHKEVIGTPQQISDLLEEWFTNGAADGFNIMPAVVPDGLTDFVELVIPELQKRGLFKTDYTGETLRDHLQLKRPQNQFTAVAVK